MHKGLYQSTRTPTALPHYWLQLEPYCAIESFERGRVTNKYDVAIEDLLECAQYLGPSTSQSQSLGSYYIDYLRIRPAVVDDRDEFVKFAQASHERLQAMLTEDQRHQYSKLQWLAAVKRRGLLVLLHSNDFREQFQSTAPTAAEMETIESKSKTVAKQLSETMNSLQAKYLARVLTPLPPVIRAKAHWISSAPIDATPPLELLLYHCGEYE